jgi:nuclear pore complex protein Nup205
MSFLVKLANGRDGAERLLDADALTILSQCSFLAVYDATEGVMEEDGNAFVSSAQERRIELEIPVLELVVATTTAVGPQNVNALRQVRCSAPVF